MTIRTSISGYLVIINHIVENRDNRVKVYIEISFRSTRNFRSNF
jgi:hypothetical protein